MYCIYCCMVHRMKHMTQKSLIILHKPGRTKMMNKLEMVNGHNRNQMNSYNFLWFYWYAGIFWLLLRILRKSSAGCWQWIMELYWRCWLNPSVSTWILLQSWQTSWDQSGTPAQSEKGLLQGIGGGKVKRWTKKIMLDVLLKQIQKTHFLFLCNSAYRPTNRQEWR